MSISSNLQNPVLQGETWLSGPSKVIARCWGCEYYTVTPEVKGIVA
jgi:hypothetical protein